MVTKRPGIYPIPLVSQVIVSGSRLRQLRREAVRMGFSRRLDVMETTVRLREANRPAERLGDGSYRTWLTTADLQPVELKKADVRRLPGKMWCHVSKAYEHYSCDGLRNIRLVVQIPVADDYTDWWNRLEELAGRLEPHFIDITEDSWCVVQREAGKAAAR